MALTEDEVRSLGVLARIGISDGDIGAVRDNLSRIIDFVDQLEAADTDEVTPMAHPLDTAQRLREDAVTEPDRRERNQQDAPAVEAGLYLVPRVLE